MPALTEQPSGGGGAGFFTRKMGPLPVWGWLAVAVVAWYLYSRNKAASGGGGGLMPTTLPAVATETLTGAGGSYTGPWGGAPGGIVSPTPGGGSGTGQQFTTPQGEQLAGSGYYFPGSTQPILGSDLREYQWVQTSGQAHALQAGGVQLYYQPTPGVFEKSPGNLAGGTPQFIAQPGQYG